MAKGNEFMKLDEALFSSLVKAEIQKHINQIKFNGSTSLPYQLRSTVDAKRHELKTQLLRNTQNVVKIPSDYLSIELLTKGWETATNTLKQGWEKRIRDAIGARKVTTSGDHKCPKCGNDHSPGVGHKACGKGALWYWVDAQTKYCVCDGCKELSRITSVCCWSCSTTLKAEIVPIS